MAPSDQRKRLSFSIFIQHFGILRNQVFIKDFPLNYSTSFKTVFLLLFISLGLLPDATSQFVRIDATSQSEIESFINQQKSKERIVGLSVGIIRDGEVVYLKGFGYQDSLKDIKATENTKYRLASVSKSITGLIAMRLLENGELDLDKDIRSYVPEYPVKPEGTITSEELLSNESGIIHYSGTSNGQYCSSSYDKTSRNNYIDDHTSRYDPIAAIDIFKNQPICFTPGKHYQYTTWGFCLMGAVLERAAKRPFEQVLFEEIVCPLSLPTLQIEYQDNRPYPNETAGYEIDDGKIIPTPTTLTDYKDVSYKTPGGGLISSVVDLTLIMKGVVNRELLSDKTVAKFGTWHYDDSGERTYYGYGTSSGSRNGDSLFWHSGSQAKTATIIYYSPENKNGVAIMANTYGAYLFPMARLIYDYLPNTTIKGDMFEIPKQEFSWSNSSVRDTICQGEEWNGYKESGTYTDQLMAQNGCDSFRTVHLVVLPKNTPRCTPTTSEVTQKLSWSLFPNPANETLTIRFGTSTEYAREVGVYDALGALIKTRKGNGSSVHIDISNLPNGVYLARWSSIESGHTFTQQFIKNSAW